MVFPGRFSTGCLRCRQRKVKCDEAKPSCKRCERYGKECTGYTDQFHFRYSSTAKLDGSPIAADAPVKLKIHQSPVTERSRRTPSIAWSDESVVADEPTPPPFEGPPGSTLSQIIRPPSQSYDHVSLCYFINRFVSPGGLDSFPGHLSFLPSLYNHHDHGILETATLSVANMAAYNQFGGEKFRVQSYTEYGRTLRMMQDIIRVEDQAKDDKVIAAVLLLCTLEDISGERPFDDNEHTSGLFYLLEKRGLEQLLTGRGTELLLLALLRLQIYSFMRDDDQYSDPGGIVTLLAPFNPLFHALSIMSKTLSLRKTLLLCATVISAARRNTTRSGLTTSSDAHHHVDFALRDGQRTLQSCFAMLAEFDELDHEAAKYWRDNFEGRSVPTSLGRVSESGAFLDAETACVVILLRAARLSLLTSMLQWHDMAMRGQDDTDHDERLALLLGDQEAWAACATLLEQDVVRTIDDILASVPFAFGDVDPSGLPTTIPYDGAAAIVILHSIRLLTYCTYATPSQLQSVRAILDRMNGNVGIRSAVAMLHPGMIQSVPYRSSRRMSSCASSGYRNSWTADAENLEDPRSGSLDNGNYDLGGFMNFTY